MRAVLEKVILSQCKTLLNVLKIQGKLTYRRIHSVAIPRGDFKKGTGRFSKNKDMAGISDLVIFLNAGTTLWVELKSRYNKPSDEQLDFKTEIEKHGHHYHVVKEVTQLESLLQTFGVHTR